MMEEKNLLTKARIEGGAFKVPQRSFLCVHGKDALRYLNGQVTADLRKLSDDAALQACLLTPKGKLVALVQIIKKEESFFVETEPSLQEAVVERLERYLVADDVQIDVLSTASTIHVFGKLAESSAFQKMPGITISRLRMPGKDIDAALFLSSPEKFSLLPAELVEVLRIERGLPRWDFELTSETLPPEARLDEVAIDYEKGCYLGQEIISRLKSVGHVNRLLYVFSADRELQRGMEIFSATKSSCGVLTSAAIDFSSERWIALGYLRRGSENETSLMARNLDTGLESPLVFN